MTADVLIVDGVAEFRAALRRALGSHGGYSVVGEASDAAGALELARDLQPEVVIVDLDLPRLAGTDLISRLRSDVGGCRVVVSSRSGRMRPPGGNDERTRADIIRLIGILDDLTFERFPTVVIDLPNEPESVARSRRFVESWCRAWDAPEVLDRALLVVSELVTNAITHGGGICELRLRLADDALRIEVVDDGSGSPEIARTSHTDEGGRGLRIVTLTTRAWGVADGDGKTKVIWAEIPTAVQTA